MVRIPTFGCHFARARLAEVIKAAGDEQIRQAGQGEVMHNDDTSMRVLSRVREASDDRTGVSTFGIVSTQ